MLIRLFNLSLKVVFLLHSFLVLVMKYINPILKSNVTLKDFPCITGDSGKENDEDISISWRGSRSSIASKASRSSRPRSGLFNQFNSNNILASKPVLGETNKSLNTEATKSVLSETNKQTPAEVNVPGSLYYDYDFLLIQM